MIRLRVPLLLVILLLTACAATEPEATPVSVRVANGGTLSFDEVTVWFPDSVVNYGAVPAGTRSEYRSVERAFGYARVDIRVGNEVKSLVPIDYVGEPFLPAGRYTYTLSLEEGEEYPSFGLGRDE